MKDIDFDELDKAVNSLMATAPEAPAASGDDVKPETTLDVSSPTPTISTATPTPVPSAVPSAQTPTELSETIPVTTSAATPAPSAPVTPAVKRSGRFMDMVHTSSDMKPRPVSPTPSREGLSITPRTGSVAPTPAPDQSVPEPSAPTSSPVESTTPQVMPDPIELSGTLGAPEPEPTPAPSDEPTVPTPAVAAESPFIADAKVEKRPLNPEVSAANSIDAQLANELKADQPDEPTEPAPTDEATDEPPATPQVPELSSDLVAIESNDKIEEPVVTQATDTKDAASDVDTPTVPLGATSIAKQYKSQPSTGDQSHAAIYDASQYPEPVTHPAKKKSGWLWVLWVVLLLGVGAGAAVLLYSMGIIP